MFPIIDFETDPPQLGGGICRECGFVFFPFQSYGCERCGAYGDSLQPVRLRGSGEVSATTTVHRHADPSRKAPFQVVQVELEQGPRVRALSVEGAEIEVGSPVELVRLSDVDVSEDPRLAVRFAPVTKESW
ncbi:OB-fold domain-containing protein [Streptomyces sp. NPDC008092]|uniref:Zn-ribbon domain-containing OB-fold protein n=1 Tax=Streptomyces sp. NPDC008092 TaxID=3364808 RepID=UPI0036EB22BE